MQATADRASATYRWDLLRGVLTGLLETIWQTFALLVMIRIFEAEELLKPLVPAAMAAGFIISPVALWLASRMGWSASRSGSIYYLLGGAGFVAAAFAQNLTLFVVAVVLAMCAFAQMAPVMTSIYSQNYPPTERGQRLSTTLVLTALFGALAAWSGGALMDIDASRWRWLFLAAGGCAFAAAFVMLRIPSDVPEDRPSLNPFKHLSLAWSDRLFGRLLFGWMLIGLGNLMTLPLRVEYVANPVYGVQASNAQVALLTLTIPRVFSLISLKAWGWIFDRTNVIAMRLALNGLFLTSILLYFLSTNIVVIGVAAVMLGLALGGGGIIWPLWVTRVAPEGQVPAYMSVHTSLTGLRGVLAPFIGFMMIAHLSPETTALISASLIFASTLVFVPMRGGFSRGTITG